ncbi:hypothetical protein FSC37_15130 [Piscinibacter aquaticus]|uniref:Uncharacterized protein n=1 Tax=Piscinibacter aquaticus TaxID=392597 RepID=A0A5C6U0U4_9BURK|nr:hypothetical protein FSC37_15130 [Piscinibacter aquaticus]
METITHNSDRWLRQPSQPVAETVIEALLAAHRAGTLDEWLRRRRRIARWLMRHWLRPLLGAAGETLDAAHPAAPVVLLLRWAVGEQRPDRADLEAPIGRDAWLDRTSWRPALAMACQYGFLPVPVFRERYRGHADEAAASQLCGLWSVGASTYYRYLDKAKRALALKLRTVPASAEQRLALRRAGRRWAELQAGLQTAEARASWHARHAAAAQLAGDSLAALWHWPRPATRRA